MTKVEILRKLVEKVTGFKSNGTTISECLDDLNENYKLSQSLKIASYESTFTTTSETSTIPINISQYNKENDVLIVYINKLKAINNVDYVISNDGQSIELTKSLLADQTVEFVVIRNE